MNQEQIDNLNLAISTNDHYEFEDLVGEFTASELNKISDTLHKDFAYMLWSCSVSWGFEFCWASYLTMTEEEKQNILRDFPEHDFSVPENFNGDVPLKDSCKWAPQDQMNRLYAV